MEGICYLCKENKDLTMEHIIPQAIGGFLKSSIYCSSCNKNLGREVDSVLVSSFSRYATLLNVRRERGEHQPFTVADEECGFELEFRNGLFRRKSPVVGEQRKDSEGNILSGAVDAGSESKLSEILTGLCSKHGIDLDSLKLESSERPPPSGEVDLVLTGDNLYRAIAKIAYSFACIKLPADTVLSSSFDGIRGYIKGNNKSKFVSLNYESTGFMTDNNRPLNKIHLAFNRLDGIVIGYVAIFGTFRYTILIGEHVISNLEWPAVDHTSDPVRRQEVPIPENFTAPKIPKEKVLNPDDTEQSVTQELNNGLKIICKYSKATSQRGALAVNVMPMERDDK